ncbi:PepSY domain-containing protein [Methylocaldum sp.]|uniref:PepSY domain-containing protein n=1 Tax=Methylocaldum sp. TaxID=1969727 RepID=UPI002D57F0D3|nr:PepSY domain-containing protein [Methylocaldum sp.]HYE34622.1 PepSY domain-containing protein [Methylocaldum sp.]
MRFIIFGLLSLGSLVGCNGRSTEQNVPLEQVPPAVRAAADKAVPGVKWEKAETETEKGQAIYEMKGRDSLNREVEVEVTPEGTLVEAETEIPLEEVPIVVREALKARFPNFKPEEIESVAKGVGSGGYEFEGRDERNKKIEVFISADGSQVTVEEDSD